MEGKTGVLGANLGHNGHDTHGRAAHVARNHHTLAARLLHSGGEALLAFLAILIWHSYNAHLAPGKMPVDTTMFHGKVSEERMHHEYPLEYERIVAREKKAEKKQV